MITSGQEQYYNLPRNYSLTLKKKVVEEVESGRLSKDGARRKYDIKGKTTVLRWCRKYGKLHQLGLKVTISMKTEEAENQELKRQILILKGALKDVKLKLEAQELLISLAEEKYKIGIRKKTGSRQQN